MQIENFIRATLKSKKLWNFFTLISPLIHAEGDKGFLDEILKEIAFSTQGISQKLLWFIVQIGVTISGLMGLIGLLFWATGFDKRTGKYLILLSIIITIFAQCTKPLI